MRCSFRECHHIFHNLFIIFRSATTHWVVLGKIIATFWRIPANKTMVFWITTNVPFTVPHACVTNLSKDAVKLVIPTGRVSLGYGVPVFWTPFSYGYLLVTKEAWLWEQKALKKIPDSIRLKMACRWFLVKVFGQCWRLNSLFVRIIIMLGFALFENKSLTLPMVSLVLLKGIWYQW